MQGFGQNPEMSQHVWSRVTADTADDLRGLGRRRLRNHHASGMNITTWTWEYFRKPLSRNKVCCCVKKPGPETISNKHQFCAGTLPRSPSSSHMDGKTTERHAVVQVHIAARFWGKNGCRVRRDDAKADHPAQKPHLSWYEVHQSPQHGGPARVWKWQRR